MAWPVLEASWAVLEASWAVLGSSWGRLVEIFRVNNLWLAANEGDDEANYRPIMETKDFSQGVMQATKRCLRVFAKLLFKALQDFPCPWEVWKRSLVYPQNIEISLQKLSQSEQTVFEFFCSLYSLQGTSLFHNHGSGGSKGKISVLRWIKSSAWKIVLPLELAQVLLTASVVTTIGNTSKHGYARQKYYLDVPTLVVDGSLRESCLNKPSKGDASVKRSKTEESASGGDDSLLLHIVPYGARGKETPKPYRLSQIAMTMEELHARMTEMYPPNISERKFVESFWQQLQ